MGLLSLLALSYLGSILDPQRHLHDYPLVVVNADRGEYGGRVADAVIAALPADQVQVRLVEAAVADDLMSAGKAYGAILIPSDFTARLTALDGLAAGDGTPPRIDIQTNPRAGTTAVTLTVELLTPILERINRDLGIETVDRARANGVPLSDAALAGLDEPIRVQASQFRPLPEGTANGISAFYYTLLVVFAGFTASTLINSGVDASVKNVGAQSKWRILLFKWALAAVVALTMAGVYQLIARWLGMPLTHPLLLYFFSTFASLAIGMTALANLTVVSTLATALRAPTLINLGMPINMLLFVALGLPSSGGIVPIEAAPRPYGILAAFEPMHQVFLGIRSILYFDARTDAGLTRALVMCTAGTIFAVIVGILTTLGYDRLHNHARNQPSS
ncbi:YhgE/Pip domain-containing protein [Nocardia sp. CDC160]|uniref:YhgE/Pip domain-containing protein n=1 Tax=Nocardia sp. CDC160 TaxID=3112166 RepID=UPI002DB96E8E|nr:DUF3533 domain-containing protein [Nocardia sp. CDC160]MEC3916230.1 DUF3533 domain-containing protein [Nocardia sp. CDC160]